jgi:hypothetical protein
MTVDAPTLSRLNQLGADVHEVLSNKLKHEPYYFTSIAVKARWPDDLPWPWSASWLSYIQGF